MRLETERWEDQVQRWPRSGKHILAQCSGDVIWVYQAYRADIAEWATAHQRFGGPWSFGRMTWVKTNFLWMMYRSGWATKDGQERVLAIALPRRIFVADILGQAVSSSFEGAGYDSREERQEAVRSSEVRLQWDPDHGPHGEKLSRRAIQLGLRGRTSRLFATEWAVQIEDITEFVKAQRQHLPSTTALLTPREDVFLVDNPTVAARVGADVWHPV